MKTEDQSRGKEKSVQLVVKEEKIDSSLSMSLARPKSGRDKQARSLNGTPESKRKQRDIRSFFSTGAPESPSAAVGSKKSPVKLRFEGGAAVLKKDLAGIKVYQTRHFF